MVYTAKRQQREEKVQLTSGVSFGFELVLTHSDGAVKSLTEKYYPFHLRSADCPYVIPQPESPQAALMGLDGRVRGIDCSVSLRKGMREAFSHWEGREEKNPFFFLIFTQEYIC